MKEHLCDFVWDMVALAGVLGAVAFILWGVMSGGAG